MTFTQLLRRATYTLKWTVSSFEIGNKSYFQIEDYFTK